MKPSIRSSAVIALLGFTACDGAPETRRQQRTMVRDSAGIRIVEHSSLATTVESWVIGPDPELRIGALDGPPALTFGTIAGVTELSNGTIVVADAQARQIRAFDKVGQHLWTAGRAGQGPGEFTRLSGVAAFPGDSVLAWETTNARLHVFDARGTFQRMFTLEPSEVHEVPAGDDLAVRGSPLGVLSNGTIVATPGAPIPTPLSPATPGRPTFLVAYHDAEGRIQHVVDRFPLIEQVLHEGRVRLVELGPSTAVAAAGLEFAAIEQESFELRRYDAQGKLTMILRVATEPTLIDDAVRARHAEANIREIVDPAMLQTLRRQRLTAPYAKQLPAVRNLQLDDQQRIWVQEFVPPYEDRAPVWWVFDSTGALVARASFPEHFVPQIIRGDQVLGVRLDAFNVPYVDRLRRTIAPAPN